MKPSSNTSYSRDYFDGQKDARTELHARLEAADKLAEAAKKCITSQPLQATHAEPLQQLRSALTSYEEAK